MSSGVLPVHVVTASAGTGKTHRLVDEVERAVLANTLAVAILATTFTNRAAAEMVSRARAELVNASRRDDAERLLTGRFGTVNSVFGALLREFAFEGGRSPVTEVIPEERARLFFRMAADRAFGEYADELQAVAERLGYGDQRAGRGTTWMELVAQVVDLTRANGISPQDLALSRDRSWAGLSVLLEPARAGETADGLDSALGNAVTRAIRAIGGGDGTKGTDGVLQELRETDAILASGRPLQWQRWAKLAKIKASKASDYLLDAVRLAAAAHARHPRLRADVDAMIRGVFDCAAAGLDAYRDFKMVRGLVDFGDQEAEALKLLGRPDVARILADRLVLALVDEFQDTSPIQLALFLRMARIVRRSVWVGDPKQSIYAFRGSDPELMAAVAKRIPAVPGGSHETLATSYRSRPGLVGFVNHVFVPAFLPQGIAREQAECAGVHRTDAKAQPVPLAVWHIQGKNKEARAAALAAGVRRMLGEPSAWPIVPKGSDEPRDVRGGDIAILCRTGEACMEVALSLEAAGIEVALGRAGLLESAECALALANLRWLADPSDSLALAEIAHLTEETVGDEQPRWFESALGGPEGHARLRAHPIAIALDALRPSLLSMTPAEALDAAIAAADIVGHCVSWGNAERRLGYLDALRALAHDYEEDRRQERKPATTGGLIAWVKERAAEKPASGGDHAVVVTTYHGAKGLEWPVTILFQLDTNGRPRLFDQVVAESGPDGIDLDDPLAGRWLRLWPWPYGAQAKDVGLDMRAAQCEVGRNAARQAAEEDVRLLYVAMTRARDYLVLAVGQTKGNSRSAALDALVDADSRSLVDLSMSDGGSLVAGGRTHACRAWTLVEEAEGEEPAAMPASTAYDAVTVTAGTPVIHLPYRLRPSGAPARPGGARILERFVLGPRLAITGSPDMAALGDAVHGFFAADQGLRMPEARQRLAESLMRRWGVGGALAPADVVAAADRLSGFISTRWPGVEIRREWPIAGRVAMQRVNGRLDLLIETPKGLIIIDHKTYPGRPDTWEGRAIGYAGQLELYGQLCAAATDKSVEGLFVHLPVAGAILRVAGEGPAS